MSKALEDISAERKRHIKEEGWTFDHDDQHAKGELAAAASCYSLPPQQRSAYWSNSVPRYWPWHHSWWKPGDRRRELVKAGALILAEIERLDRASAKLT